MRRFFASRFFIIALTVALSMIAVPAILASMGLTDVVRQGVSTVLMPGQRLFSFVANGISGFADYFTEYDRLEAENRELRQQLAKMQDRVYSAEELERMNEWLYDYLEIKREHMDFTLVEAAVTGRQSSNYMSVIQINRGTASGCGKDMPVITADGVVGYVEDCGRSWAKVVTLCESTSAIGATVERTGESGLVSGSYTLAADSLVKMTYLAADSDVAQGDRIVTSGYGSVYPRGLVIGYVERVEMDDFSQNKVAYVKLAVTPDDLTNVMVITDYENTVQE